LLTWRMITMNNVYNVYHRCIQKLASFFYQHVFVGERIVSTFASYKNKQISWSKVIEKWVESHLCLKLVLDFTFLNAVLLLWCGSLLLAVIYYWILTCWRQLRPASIYLFDIVVDINAPLLFVDHERERKICFNCFVDSLC
jgi:hypothetical protein